MATFQVLKNHMSLVANILDSTDIALLAQKFLLDSASLDDHFLSLLRGSLPLALMQTFSALALLTFWTRSFFAEEVVPCSVGC